MQTEQIRSCESCSAGSYASAHYRPERTQTQSGLVCDIIAVTRSGELYGFYDEKASYSSPRLQSCISFIHLNPVPQNWLFFWLIVTIMLKKLF